MTPDRLREALHLKHVARAGWQRVGIDAPESVAAHSWGVALLVLLTAPPHLDRERCLTYAVLHDLAEARVGDITPHDGVTPQAKHEAEAEAMAGLLADHPDLLARWLDYEAQRDDEARFVRQLDRLDMVAQASTYEARHGVQLDEFYQSAAEAITSGQLVRLASELRATTSST